MELKQLSYFLLACRHRNHAEAAQKAGIAASAFSENFKALEEELGLELFRRGPLGHYPSESARWLYQNVEPVLQHTEAIEQIALMMRSGETRYWQISTPMQFMFGRLSSGVSAAIHAFRATHPHIVIRSTFGTQIDHLRDQEPEEEGFSHLLIDYADQPQVTGSEVLLFHDDWIAITNFDRGAEQGRVLEFKNLCNLRLLLPPLPSALTRAAVNYCSQHGLPAPVTVEEDVGTFPRLSRDAEPFVLLAPRSLVSGGLDRLQLNHATLPLPLTSPVVVKNANGHPDIRSFVDLLVANIQETAAPVVHTPSVTLRQLRYYEVILDQLNITAAARKLNIVQPAVSSQLRKFEQLLGTVLFERHRNGLTPTEAAKRLAPLVRRTVAQCDYVIQQAAREASARGHRVTIGLVPLVNHQGTLVESLAGALGEWRENYPQVQLRILEAPAAILHRWVEQEQISFGIVEAHVSRSSQLDLKRQDRLAIISKAGDGLLLEGEMKFSEIQNLPLVLPSDIFGLRQLLDRAAQTEGFTLHPQMEVNSLAMSLALVKQTRVVTVLPETAIQTLAGLDQFQVNLIADPVVFRRWSVIFSTNRNLTEIERSLISVLRRNLATAGISESNPADTPANDDLPIRTGIH